MAIVDRLRQLLKREDVNHDVITFPPAYTAQQIAHNAHVTGRRLAKVVVVRDESGRDLMLVLPASKQVDPLAVRGITGRAGMQLESEAELQRIFPDCEVGAMPPFGNLYGLPMFVDRCLARQPDVFFEAGNHHELVHMHWSDYARLAAPIRADRCLHEQMAEARV